MNRKTDEKCLIRDYRCVRYRDCLTRAAHAKNGGAIGFDCGTCGKFEMQAEKLIRGIDTEHYSVGHRIKPYSKNR